MDLVQGLLDSVAELQENANVNAIFGDPVIFEERIVIPVAKVSYGFHMGVGYDGTTDETENHAEGSGESDIGAGGGGAVHARPFAVIEVTPESVRVEPIVDEQKLATAGSLLVGWGIFCLAKTLIKIFGPRK